MTPEPHRPGTPRPFRFFTSVGDVVDGKRLAEDARRAEAIGYSGLVIPDHLVEMLAPIPALATIAAATTTLRIGTFVLNNDLRHPAVLAQDLATLDILSAGRLDVGIGGGWNEPEFLAAGIPFDSVGTRVGRLAESVAVLKGLFADGPFSYQGRHYRITAMDGLPKPVQRPHPPFLIGGGGRRTLPLAGREAQIVGLAPRVGPGTRADAASLTFEAAEEKVGWVREAAGDRFAELELNIYPSGSQPMITDHARAEGQKVADRINARGGMQLTVDQVLDSPHVFIGTLDALVDKFRTLRDRLGISSVMLGNVDDLAPVVERLAGR